MKAANNRNSCAISDMDNSCNYLFLLAMTVTQITREPAERKGHGAEGRELIVDHKMGKSASFFDHISQ